MLAQNPGTQQLSQTGQFQFPLLTAFEKLEQSCINYLLTVRDTFM